jgi:translocation and assembly module TamA
MRWAPIAWSLAAVLASGCAGLSPTAPRPAEDPAGAAPSPAATPAWRVEVEAPEALKALLERHLDVVRLASLTTMSELGTQELSRLLDATPSQARDLLQTEGYFDAEVRVEPLADSTPELPRWRVVALPGPLTTVQRFDLELEGELSRELDRGDPAAKELLAGLRATWPMKPGAPMRNAQWSDAKAALLSRLRAAGYAMASFSGTTAQVDAPRHRARLFLVADSGPLFRSGDIAIEGLQLQRRDAVVNLAGFGRGQPLTEALLLDFQDRLAKSGLFEHATVTVDLDPAQAANATLQVRVKEQARHQVITGLGFSTNAGPRATLEHVDKRLFGFAASARNKFEWGRMRQAWDGEVSTHVRPDNYRWFTGGTIERLKTDTDTVLAQRLRLGRAMESARIERIQYLELDRAKRSTAIARTLSEAVTANQGWIWRDVDNPLLPTEGETLSLNLALGQSRSTGVGSGPLARALGRVTLYRPLGSNWYGQARVELGQVFVRNASSVTDNLGFRAGGDESVRGYAHRSLGPLREGAVASGKVMFTGSVEVARPMFPTMPTLWGAAFIDAGDAADDWRSLGVVVGSGVGLRWRSPVGPLKLDLAYGHAAKRVRLHFSVGIVF